MGEYNDNIENLPSISDLGARKGLLFGVYLVAIFVAFANGNGDTFLTAFALTMMAAVPLVLFRMLRGIFLRENGESSFQRIWLIGCSIFAFGSVIFAFGVFVWMQYVHPGYLYEMAAEALKGYAQVPELNNSAMAQTLRVAVDNGDLPSPIAFAISMAWSVLTSGVLLSLVVTVFARMGGKAIGRL